MKNFAVATLLATFPFLGSAQLGGLVNRVKNKTTHRVDTRIDEAIDKGLDKAEGKLLQPTLLPQLPAAIRRQPRNRL